MKLRGKDRNQILFQRILGCLNINQKGTYVDDVEKDYQFSGLVAAAKSNIYINQLIDISQCWIYKLSGRTIGAAGDLVNTYESAVMELFWMILNFVVVMYDIQNKIQPLMARLLCTRRKQSYSVLSPRIGI